MEHKCNKSDVKAIEKCELNLKQVINALELHANAEKSCVDECPYGNMRRCGSAMAKDALSLINELTRKLELANLEIECKERICESYMLQYGTVADKEVWLKKERADTVRKMQERLHERKVSYGNITFRVVPIDDIDQIAKEMVEGIE